MAVDVVIIYGVEWRMGVENKRKLIEKQLGSITRRPDCALVRSYRPLQTTSNGCSTRTDCLRKYNLTTPNRTAYYTQHRIYTEDQKGLSGLETWVLSHISKDQLALLDRTRSVKEYVIALKANCETRPIEVQREATALCKEAFKPSKEVKTVNQWVDGWVSKLLGNSLASQIDSRLRSLEQA